MQRAAGGQEWVTGSPSCCEVRLQVVKGPGSSAFGLMVQEDVHTKDCMMLWAGDAQDCRLSEQTCAGTASSKGKCPGGERAQDKVTPGSGAGLVPAAAAHTSGEHNQLAKCTASP